MAGATGAELSPTLFAARFRRGFAAVTQGRAAVFAGRGLAADLKTHQEGGGGFGVSE